MTDKQFEKLMEALIEINNNVKLITAYNAGKDSSGKDNYNLSDLHSAIGNIRSEISSLETAINDVKNAVNNIHLS